MNKGFEKLAKEISFTISESFLSTSLSSAQLNKDENVFHLSFQISSIIPLAEMRTFLLCLNNNFKYRAQPNFKAQAIVFEEKTIRDYLYWIVSELFSNFLLANSLKAAPIKIDNQVVEVILSSSSLCEKVEAKKEDIERIMRKFGFDDFQIKATFVKANDFIEEERKNLEERVAQMSNAKPKSEEVKKFSPAKEFTKVSLSDLETSHLQKVAVEGEIFNVTHKSTKSNFVITELAITDYKDAIIVKLFARSEDEASSNHAYFKGQYVYVSGDYQFDTFSKEAVIVAKKITTGTSVKFLREDNAPQKRIELSARTRMSAMDGVVSAKELVERVKTWNHQAIAITDAENVQSYPEFFAETKAAGIKAIYGISVNVLSRNSQAIKNVIPDQKLLSDNYVVFDLETTGLSATYNELIEFGAIKVQDGQIVDSKQFFIKPTKPISDDITKITGITNEMVSGAIDEKQAMTIIREFFDQSTLVAHNANFDMSFIDEKLEKYELEPLTLPIIDTLIVARIVNPSAKKFRLENVAIKYGVEYDSLVAHRADYDADVLAKVWLKMMHDLRSLDIITHDDLYNYQSRDLYTKAFTSEVTLLAKNQEGLKELFKIVSVSSTDNFYRQPTVFLEDLQQRKNILLGSGSLKSRLVDKMLFSSQKELREEIALYDYIEVQPPKNFSHLLQTKGFMLEDIKNALSLTVSEAKKQGKIVVATGDVRYLDEEQKIYHDVYIHAKGLGGVRHHLYSYDRKDINYPVFNLLTTDEMLKEFSFLNDIMLMKEIVIENTHKIANQISYIEVTKKGLFTPKMGDSDELMTKFVYENARKMYGEELPKIIEERIERELTPIKKYGFGVIYWISHLLVSKSLADGYLVGSRGSVGSSLVATLLNITEVNPLPPHYICNECKAIEFPEVNINSGYDLPAKKCPKCNNEFDRQGQNIPFETFLGFNADKTPDIDLNFSGEYQATVHDEVKRLFGASHSFRAGTISTVAEKTAFGYVLAWAEEKNRTLSRAFTEFIAKGVTGTKRTTGQHPGGIIVIPKDMDVEDFTPINFPANDVNSSWKTTHFDFHAIHDNVLKLDLLGHDDPTAIRMLEKQTKINAKRDIPFNDKRVLSLFSSTNELGIKPSDINNETTGAMGIPEFGTQFVRRMLKKTKVESFGDLIAVSGLSHGTDVWTNNAELLVVQQNKKLDEIISCRDNIMTDLIAKGVEPLIAFKIMENVRKGKGVTPEQEELLKKHDVQDWYIDSLKKIKYMFPKAHATAYVMMAWRVAWFKLYYPLAYYATYFSTRADVFDIHTVVNGHKKTLQRLEDLDRRRNLRGQDALTNKEEELIPILELAVEAFARGIKIGNIDLNKSLATEWLIEESTNTLIPPFISLDGLGNTVAESIISARKDKLFQSIEDLQKRTTVNKTTLEKLRLLGVFDGLDEQNQITFKLF